MRAHGAAPESSLAAPLSGDGGIVNGNASEFTTCALCERALGNDYQLAGPSFAGPRAVLHRVCASCGSRLQRDPSARRLLTRRSREILNLLDAVPAGAG